MESHYTDQERMYTLNKEIIECRIYKVMNISEGNNLTSLNDHIIFNIHL